MDCACAVGLGLGPLVFTLWASTWADTKNDSLGFGQGGLRQKSGARGGTQLIDFENKALVYLYLDSLLPLRYGAFYMQPGGSSLDPRPDLQATASAADLSKSRLGMTFGGPGSAGLPLGYPGQPK